jgi:hypothetical protein
MTVFISRDFPQYDVAFNPNFGMYCLSIFTYAVMGFSVAGYTSFDIEANKLAEGTAASINQGGDDDLAVAIPPGDHTVTITDIGKVLVLKSSTNPKHNAGLFRIIGVDIGNNWVYIDYRSADSPPAETGMSYFIFNNESSFSFSASPGSGTGTEYRTKGDSTAARVILESPDGWQVRFTRESTTDDSNIASDFSITCGINGDSAGDWEIAGEHTHHPLWYNDYARGSRNLMASINGGNTPSRFYMWGDNETGTIVGIWRHAGGDGAEGIVAFGLTEDEEEPLPESIVGRCFAIGPRGDTSQSVLYLGFGEYDNSHYGGNAYGDHGIPVGCVLAQYVPLSLQDTQYFDATLGAPQFSGQASDSIISKKLELLPTEVVAGTWDQMYGTSTVPTIVPSPRRIGTCPLIRVGRANIGDFVLTSNSSDSWFHTRNGVYMPWGGPGILP